jgi:hypothetical protein
LTFRCAEVSLELDEPLAGTAPVTARWELVERAKPWGREHGLVSEGAKVLLVRRASRPVPRDLVPGHVPENPQSWTCPGTWSQRRYFVCTNGARDPCCAIRGPAVAQALERTRPGQVYECSHLGGHRFAANVLVLPDGLCFGRLDARTAPALVRELDAGRLPLQHLRGRTSYEPEQQAAEIIVRRELGLVGLDELRLVGVSGSEPHTVFELTDGRRFRVRLEGKTLQPRRVSCRDEKVEPPTQWTLGELEA